MNPTESFVPLSAAPAPAAPREFRVAILNHPDHAAPGEPAGKTPAAALQSLQPVFNGLEKKIGEPRVSVQRDGGRVTHLRIQCACGQIMDLACVYDAPPAA